GHDAIFGGKSNDRFGLASINSIEFIDGGAGYNRIEGNDANSILDFSSTRLTNIHLIEGSDGDDEVVGWAGSDHLAGGNGNDVRRGGAGADNWRGENGDDVIFGGDGTDALEGGRGSDLVVGGSGSDTYIRAPDSGDDFIIDFDLLDSGDPWHADTL